MGRVENKFAIVTGGASGLGQASAVLLASEGAAIVLTDIQADKGEATAATIRSSGGNAHFISHDVTDEAAWQRVTAEALKRHGRLDVLVNAAGIAGGDKTIVESSLDYWRQIISINLDGTFLGVKHAFKAMVKSGGSIINISSVLGLIGLPRSGAYAASKGGVRLLTKAAAAEGKRLGIRVNSIHPGFIDTPMLQQRLQSQSGERMAKFIESVQGPIGEPVDIAEGILYLASDASKFVTGTELVIDGGMTAQ